MYQNCQNPNDVSVAHSRRLLCQLPVVGSYMNIPLDSRICEKCNNNSIGYELFHYVLQCDFFKDKSESFIKKYYYNKPPTFNIY